MKRGFNAARLVQGIGTALTGFAFLWLAMTRCYQYYVTPRTLPYLYFAAAMFLLTGAYNFTKLHEVTHVRRYAHLIVLLIPLVLLAASTKAQGLWNTPFFPTPAENEFNEPALLDETYAMQTSAYAGHLIHGYDGRNKTITIMENETYLWLAEIYHDPTPFLGFTVHTMGKVVTSSDYLAEGCFSPIRKLMTCCVADMFSIGFTCQYDPRDSLTDGEWVSVTGVLTLVDMEEYTQLRILVDTVTPCSPPDEPYVYSY